MVNLFDEPSYFLSNNFNNPIVLWYGVVREYEAKTYQFTPTFFTSHKPSKAACTIPCAGNWHLY